MTVILNIRDNIFQSVIDDRLLKMFAPNLIALEKYLEVLNKSLLKIDLGLPKFHIHKYYEFAQVQNSSCSTYLG